jgi:hypothetical protein
LRRKHDLDRQLEQWAQALEDLLARLALGDPAVEERQAGAVVDKRVADNDRSTALDPEHEVERRLGPGARLDADRQPITGRVWLSFQSAGAVRRWHEHLRAEPLGEVAGVAFVPGVGEHDRGLAAARELLELGRQRQRVEQE